MASLCSGRTCPPPSAPPRSMPAPVRPFALRKLATLSSLALDLPPIPSSQLLPPALYPPTTKSQPRLAGATSATAAWAAPLALSLSSFPRSLSSFPHSLSPCSRPPSRPQHPSPRPYAAPSGALGSSVHHLLRCVPALPSTAISFPPFRNVFSSAFPSNHRRLDSFTMASASELRPAFNAAAHRHTNRLAKEHSPYLLQHAHNPVDWYPWGEDAFKKARDENKLIFLSVGYSTCHWCHVMERESFESEEVAEILNEGFVSVKVDREERPDVDKVYMSYVQATQGGGGWPMTVFLTPSLHPVLGGTYFPPEDKFGRIGFKSLLKRVKKVWGEKQKEIEESGQDAMRQLASAMESAAPESSAIPGLAPQALHKCYSQLASRFDSGLGGFGSAPKFPRPSELNLLLRRYYWGRQHPDEGGKGKGKEEGEHALHMATFTLGAMAKGGVHDHVGGGFHRYSVDDFWHVPHFEKMLYDQAQLASAYLDAFAATKDPAFALVARDILDYVLRDLTHPEGGFFSAEDADSLDKKEGAKKEGAFYVWTKQEIEEVLGSDRAALFASHYYVKESGNCDLSPMSDPHSEFVGKNVLIVRESIVETARKFQKAEGEVERTLGECREALHKERAKRPRPHLDDKVIVAWNGLMISAFARASHILTLEPPLLPYAFPITGAKPPQYLQAAIRSASFIKSKLYDPGTKQLKRSFREGASEASGFADDYTFVITALLDLFEASGGDTQWLEWALELQSTQDALFWDEAGGAYFSTPSGDPSILLRLKEDYDGAEPSPNSYAISNTARLSHYLDAAKDSPYEQKAAAIAAVFQEKLSSIPLALPQMCAFLPFALSGMEPRLVVIVGPAQAEATQRLLNAALSSASPDKLVIPVDPSIPATVAFWKVHNERVLIMAQKSGKGKEGTDGGADEGEAAVAAAAAYVCQNFSCLAPTLDPLKLRQLLDAPESGAEAQPKVSKLKL